MNLVTGSYADAEKANRAVEALVEADFEPDEISLVVADKSGGHEVAVEHDTGVSKGAAVGAALGAALGAIGGALVATGILAGPGLPVLATGPLLSALRGAVAGLGAGGVVGIMAGLGYWKDAAHLHAEDLREGAVLISVPAEGDRSQRAREVLQRTGATRVTG